MNFPPHIQNAVDLGLLEAQDGKIAGVGKEEAESVFGLVRLIEKIQPTTKFEGDDTTDQEAIVLCRVLGSPSGLARELWSDLRIAVGVSHGQSLPRQLWSNDAFRSIGGLIDRIFNGEADGASMISKQHLITAFPNNTTKFCSKLEFEQTVSDLTDDNAMDRYGDSDSEWGIALDLLRQARARANFLEAQHLASQSIKSDAKLEKAIEAQQQELMRCLGMLRGSVGNEGNATDAVEDLINPRDGKIAFIDQIMSAREQSAPVSTGIPAMDLDMEGGVRRSGESAGGRLFTLAARTGVGKTVLGVYAAVNLAHGGLKVGFISAELDKTAIYARIWAAATQVANDNHHWAAVGSIESPDSSREIVSGNIMMAANAIQENGGKLLVEDPWGADVDSVINSLRSMKAKNPDLRVAIVDHFHVLARHKGAPTSEAAMLEDRAYKLMSCAKQLEIDLIVLAQMNRVGMDSVGKEQSPTLDQIRGTDALSHVSHAVWIVRKEMVDENGEKKWKGNLEFWHVKTRGRQAVWNGSKVEGVRGFLDKSVLSMDYAYSAVKKGGDMTALLVSRLKEQKR
jgi:replicative DNA helicase